jgi:hypothetical protein
VPLFCYAVGMAEDFDQDRYERDMRLREPERRRAERNAAWAWGLAIVCVVLLASLVQSCRR